MAYGPNSLERDRVSSRHKDRYFKANNDIKDPHFSKENEGFFIRQKTEIQISDVDLTMVWASIG